MAGNKKTSVDQQQADEKPSEELRAVSENEDRENLSGKLLTKRVPLASIGEVGFDNLCNANRLAPDSDETIIRYSDITRDRETVVLKREFLDGATLQQIENEWCLESALELIRQVIQVSARYHAQGLVHQNLKPSNVLKSADGNVELLDGLWAPTAAGFKQDSERSLDYLSPEQLGLIKADVGPTTDLYSTGVMLFELLSGASPRAISDDEFELESLLKPIPSLRSLGIAVPVCVDELIHRLTATAPEARYQTATAVEQDLSLILDSLQGSEDEYVSVTLGTTDARRRLLNPVS